MGETVIAPQFEDIAGDKATPFCDGLAAVRKEGSWGYIDKRGNTVVPFEYLTARPFENGVATVRRANGWTMLDRQGKPLCGGEPFFHIGPGSEGFFKVRVLDESGEIRHGFADTACRAIGRAVYEETGEFHVGVAPVKNGPTWTWLSKSGAEVAGAGAMSDIPYFWNGFWSVRVNGKQGVVGALGEVVIPAEYNGISSMADGIFGVRNDKQRYAFYDTATKRFLTDFLYAEINAFSEGLAAVRIDEPTPHRPNVWGFIDATGAWAIAPNFLSIERSFVNGKAIVWVRENIYVVSSTRRTIDRQGNTVPSK